MGRKEKEQRQTRYNYLRSLGFNSFDANKYKDLSKEKYQKLILHKIKSNEKVNDIVNKSHIIAGLTKWKKWQEPSATNVIML